MKTKNNRLCFVLLCVIIININCKENKNYTQTKHIDKNKIKNVNLDTDFKNHKYFIEMRKKIKNNWHPPTKPNLPQNSNVRLIPIQSQEVKVYFVINRKGDILEVEILESLGNRSLDNSCIHAVKNSKNFGEVPKDINGEFIAIPFIFGY